MRAEEGDVGDADDGIVLTDREREALAGLAESIGDPWLAGQLAGQARAPEPPKRQRGRSSALRRAAAGWIGLLLALAGAAVTATTFMHSTVVASLGLGVMGVGLWRLLVERGDGIARWLAGVSGRSPLRPGTAGEGPRPPRRRRGAA